MNNTQLAPDEWHPPKPPKKKRSFLSYAQFEEAGSAAQAPLTKPNKAFIGDWTIYRKNMDPEKVFALLQKGSVVTLHRTLRDEVPLIFLLYISIALVITVTTMYPNPGFGFPGQVFGPLSCLALILHRRWNSKYYIEKDGVTAVKGILLWRLTRVKCGYDKIRVVEVRRNLLQRMLKVGDLQMTTALIDEPELTLEGLKNPYFYTTLIKLCIDDTAKKKQTPETNPIFFNS